MKDMPKLTGEQLGALATAQGLILRTFNGSLADYGSFEDLWGMEDRIKDKLMTIGNAMGDVRSVTRSLAAIGRHERVCPIRTHDALYLACRYLDRCGDVHSLAAALDPEPLPKAARLDADLEVVRRGYVTNYETLELSPRYRGRDGKVQKMQNRRYPVAVFLAAMKLSLESETEVRIVAALAGHGGTMSIRDLFSSLGFVPDAKEFVTMLLDDMADMVCLEDHEGSRRDWDLLKAAQRWMNEGCDPAGFGPSAGDSEYEVEDYLGMAEEHLEIVAENIVSWDEDPTGEFLEPYVSDDWTLRLADGWRNGTGRLTSFAYPEATERFLRYLMENHPTTTVALATGEGGVGAGNAAAVEAALLDPGHRDTLFKILLMDWTWYRDRLERGEERLPEEMAPEFFKAKDLAMIEVGRCLYEDVRGRLARSREMPADPLYPMG